MRAFKVSIKINEVIMACFVCKKTGERECDPEAAEIKCFLCGWCEAQKEIEQVQQGPL